MTAPRRRQSKQQPQLLVANLICYIELTSTPPPIGKNLPDSVREFSPVCTGLLCKSVRSSGPIGARESARIAGNIHAYMTALEQRDYPLLPPAPQEQKQSFSRVADT
jgi:hypothetical protein